MVHLATQYVIMRFLAGSFPLMNVQMAHSAAGGVGFGAGGSSFAAGDGLS